MRPVPVFVGDAAKLKALFAVVVESLSKPSSRDCRDPGHKDVKALAIPTGATSTTNANIAKLKLIVTIQRNKLAFDSVGRSLRGAEAMLLASTPLSQRFTFLAE